MPRWRSSVAWWRDTRGSSRNGSSSSAFPSVSPSYSVDVPPPSPIDEKTVSFRSPPQRPLPQGRSAATLRSSVHFCRACNHPLHLQGRAAVRASRAGDDWCDQRGVQLKAHQVSNACFTVVPTLIASLFSATVRTAPRPPSSRSCRGRSAPSSKPR